MRCEMIFAGIAMLVVSACSEPQLGVKIPFVATWGDEPIQCNDSGVALSDLRFYVSAIELVDADGKSQAIKLHNDIPWQQSDLALIDLENGVGSCMDGTSDLFYYVVGNVPPGDYHGLGFVVGVPFDRNHSNPLSAAAPLDDPAMHWHWRSGYKFMRAGIKTGNDGFWIHVGSAGCEGTARNVSGCRFANRATVELQDFRPNRDTVVIDLKIFFEGINLADGEPADCSSGPAESACVAPFGALGIDFDTGYAAGPQRVFTVRQ